MLNNKIVATANNDDRAEEYEKVNNEYHGVFS